MSRQWWYLAVAALALAGCGGGNEESGTPTPQKSSSAEASGQGIGAVLKLVAPTAPGNAVTNGGFESGGTGWTTSSGSGAALIGSFTDFTPRSGSRYAWLGGNDDVRDGLSQTIVVPNAGQQAKLQFWLRIASSDSQTIAYDKLTVDVHGAGGAKLASLATFSNLDRTEGWVKSPLYDLTPYKGQTIQIRFDASLDATEITSFLLDDVSVFPLDVAGTVPASGLWWNPNESGRGFFLERQGTQLFVGAYMYEESGTATWYTGSLPQDGNGSYSGALTRFGGGQTLAGGYRAPGTSSETARATFTFDTGSTGTLDVVASGSSTRRSTALQLFSLSGGTPQASGASFQSGIWWNASESGRGFVVEVQGNTGILAGFMYDSSGQPVWYTGTGPLTASNAFSVQLQQYADGQALMGSYVAPRTASSTVGRLAFTGTSATTAQLTLPNGNTVALTRFGAGTSSPSPTPSPSPVTPPADGGGGGGGGGATGSPYAGAYTISGGGVTVNFTVNTNASITSCSADAIVVCTGSVTSAGALRIEGNDGQSPVDTRVVLNGTISGSGGVTGSFSGNSVEDGPLNGSFSGQRTSSNGGGGTSPGAGGNACLAAMAGTWRHPVAGTWYFDGAGFGKSTVDATNYGPRAQQISEITITSCSSASISFRYTRAALINTVDPTFRYDKNPANSNTIDWSKPYSLSYAPSGSNRMQIGTTYTFDRQ